MDTSERVEELPVRLPEQYGIEIVRQDVQIPFECRACEKSGVCMCTLNLPKVTC